MPLLTLVQTALLAASFQIGATAPTIGFEDIHGNKGSSAAFADRVIIYTFADRDSSDALMAWQEGANLEIALRFPALKLAYLNFADVSGVPGFLRYVVEPILAGINERATRKLEKQFQDAKLPLDPAQRKFHLIADWKGAYLKTFGLEDAAEWRCWVVSGGRVIGMITPADARPGDRLAALLAAAGEAKSAE